MIFVIANMTKFNYLLIFCSRTIQGMTSNLLYFAFTM